MTREMEQDLILNIIEGGAGTQFDPQVVEIFRTLHRDHQIEPPAPVD